MIKSKLSKVTAHYKALKEYKNEIDKMDFNYTIDSLKELNVYQKALRIRRDCF